MAKFLRGLLVVWSYLFVSLPISIPVTIGLFIYDVVLAIRHRDWSFVSGGMVSYFEGMRDGHKTNMHYVRTGDHYGTFGVPEDEG